MVPTHFAWSIRMMCQTPTVPFDHQKECIATIIISLILIPSSNMLETQTIITPVLAPRTMYA